MSNQFNPGDRVRYIGGYRGNHPVPGSVRTGTVTEHDRPTNVRVSWDDPSKPPSSIRGVFPQNIELIEDTTVTETTPNTIRYLIRREDDFDITAGKAYVVGSDGKYRDDVGDDRFAGTRDSIYGEAKFIIRCLDAPNKSCVGKYIDEAFVPEVGNVGCGAEHKAAAHQFTLPEVIEFLRFTRKKHDEQDKTSSFEVLLAPILCTFEGEFKKPERVGTGGYKVGDRLICEASSHRGLLVGEEYVVYRIDSDNDECIEPAGSGRLALGARYAASGNSEFNEGCKFRKVEG